MALARSINGYSYGAGMGRQGDRYLVVLALGGNVWTAPQRRVQAAETWDMADRVITAFAHACAQWETVQARSRAIDRGYAVLGGPDFPQRTPALTIERI